MNYYNDGTELIIECDDSKIVAVNINENEYDLLTDFLLNLMKNNMDYSLYELQLDFPNITFRSF